MSLFTILTNDHEKISKLLDEGLESTERAIKTREELATEIKKEFENHAKMEEKIFYPVLKQYEDTKDLILEAYEEHHVVNLILSELGKTAPDDEVWKAKLMVLKENIKHHVDEEEKELFPKVKKILSDEEKKVIEEKFKQFKKNL